MAPDNVVAGYIEGVPLSDELKTAALWKSPM